MPDADRLALLCARVDGEPLYRRSTQLIRHELPEYRAVPFGEHFHAVGTQQHTRLRALAEGRPLTAAELATVADLARTRARQGIRVDTLIGAYHIGDRSIWEALSRRAAERGEADVPDLARLASLLLESLQSISTVVAAAHAEVSKMIHAAVVTSSQRLFELLAAGHHAGGEAAALAEGLGLDVQADMTVLVWRPLQPASVLPAVLLRQLEAASDNFVVAYTDAGPAALVQASPARKPLHTIRQPPEAGTLGIGLPRPGLAGAAMSLRDAELALTTLGPGPQQVADFAEVWQDACGLSDLDRLAPLLATARNIAARHRHLTEAVAAYADRDMQLGPTAATLHLHPNTIAYRLDRWAQLTGWNPRTLTGIRRSLFVTSDMGTIASGSSSDNAVLQ